MDKKMARETGLEPATSAVTGRRSNQLSYSRIWLNRLLFSAWLFKMQAKMGENTLSYAAKALGAGLKAKFSDSATFLCVISPWQTLRPLRKLGLSLRAFFQPLLAS